MKTEKDNKPRRLQNLLLRNNPVLPEPKLSSFFEPEEHRFYSESIPCGIDEAGRGPYAGPLSVALVSFSQNSINQVLEGKILKGLTDSKKTFRKKKRISLSGNSKDRTIFVSNFYKSELYRSGRYQSSRFRRNFKMCKISKSIYSVQIFTKTTN